MRSTRENDRIAIIACSGLAHLTKKALEDLPCNVKMFSIKPPCMFNIKDKYFDHYFKKASEFSSNILVVLGHCSTGLRNYLGKFGAVKHPGDNCFEMILGTELYDELLSKGSMFMLPDLMKKKAKVYRRQMNMNYEDGVAMYNEALSGLVYINVAGAPFSADVKTMIPELLGLEAKQINVSREHFNNSIKDSLNQLLNRSLQPTNPGQGDN